MATPFIPSQQDVERYRRLRALSSDLSAKIVETMPQRALEEIGEALGMLHNGVLVLDSMDVGSVVMDCCLYDWFEDGKNLVQRYAETHPAPPGTEESYLLDGYLHAEYRIVVARSVVPDAGIACDDVLNGGELFIMDRAFSRSLTSGVALATRTIPLGECWMTGGAGLPIQSAGSIEDALRRITGEEHRLLDGPGGMALTVVRACLETGAADHIAYAGAPGEPKKLLRKPRWLGSKRRRRRI
jgi:hypothetical protein